MKQDRSGDTHLTSDRRELSKGSNATPKNYQAPTLLKRAVLSTITSEDALQVSGQQAFPS
jgi:hypothetical protein